MTRLSLQAIDGNDAGLRAALLTAGLPTDDLGEGGRVFFRLFGGDNSTIGFSGLETCADDVLLRSMLILPDFRGRGHGRALTDLTVSAAPTHGDIYLATTTAASFFERLGFEAIRREDAPPAILATRQLSGLCPASATIMKRNRPPT